LNGKYVLKLSGGDNFDFSIAVHNFNGGQYKKISEKRLYKFCETLYNETFKSSFEEFQSYQKTTIPWKTCPYPAGPNEIINFMVNDYAEYLPPYMPGSEKWKVEVRFYDGEEMMGGYNFYCLLRNMKTLMGN
jgi:hypothetical protein